MGGEAHRLDARHGSGFRIQCNRIGIGDAKLVPGPAGRDLVVGLGIDVRIDAQRNTAVRPAALARAESMSSSSALSTLIWPMPSASASCSSCADLPTPE